MNDIVSIIVPVYNTKKLLTRCVRSILEQTYKNIVVYLIDDGSTDGSERLCDQFSVCDKRVKVIHQSNSGQGIARNKALDRIDSGYVFFVDSDDYIMPNAIETMINALVSNNCDLCVCGVINDHIILRKECPRKNETVIYNKEELFISYLTEPYIRGVLWNKLYKAELFRNIRFDHIRAREDVDILYQIYGNVESAIYIPDLLYTQFIRPGSTEQGGFNESKLYTISIYEKMAYYIRTNIPNLSDLANCLVAKACANAMCAIAEDSKRRKWLHIYNDLEARLKNELKNSCFESMNNWEGQLRDIANKKTRVMRKGTINRIRNGILSFIKQLAYPLYLIAIKKY